MLDASEELRKCRDALEKGRRRFFLWDRWTYLRISRPIWAANDKLQTFFRERSRLLKTGRVAWGYTVQANALLFEPGGDDCPGEVVYGVDPAVPVDVHALKRVAHRLYELKGTQQADPGLSKFSRYLADEYAREFGLQVPQCICDQTPYAVSTVFFSRKHLPNQVLSKGLFPILVSDTQPQVAMVLPSRFWSKNLRRFWVSHKDLSLFQSPHQPHR